MMTECESGLFVGVSGHEILLAVAVFCLGSAECRWDRGEWRRMDFIPIGGKEVESGSVLSYLRNDLNGFDDRSGECRVCRRALTSRLASPRRRTSALECITSHPTRGWRPGYRILWVWIGGQSRD